MTWERSRRRNFNPLPSHEGRHNQHICRRRGLHISIRSPLTRGDRASALFVVHSDNFNPLPSHEGRLFQNFVCFVPVRFQSAPLSRGETAYR